MVFDTKTAAEFHRIPKLQGAPDAVYYSDLFSSKKNSSNPLTGSLFLLNFSTKPEPAPAYDHDETGIVLHGELHLEDETGQKAVLHPGDTFFVYRDSTITFSTPRYAVAYKIAARPSPSL